MTTAPVPIPKYTTPYGAIGIHGPCMDGTAAGYVLKTFALKTFGTSPPVVPVPAGRAMPIDDRIRDKHLVIADVFPSNHVAVAAATQGLVVLDHHIGTRDAVLATSYGVYSPTMSGVGMAWAYVYGEGPEAPPLPRVLAIIQERDLGRFTCQEHNDIAMWLSQKIDFTNPDQTAAFAELDALVTNPALLEDYLLVGRQYAKMIQQKALAMIRDSRPKKCVFGDRALEYRIFNAPWDFTFELGRQGMLTTSADFIVVWQYNHEFPEEPYKVSLRSSDRGIDTLPLAKHFGGDGHRDASGFSLVMNPEEALASFA